MSDPVRAFIDLETRSTADLRKTGAHRYAEHPQTDVIVACYAFDDGPVHTWWRGEPAPADLCAHIDSGALLTAHNAEFERVMLRNVLGPRYGWSVPALEQWECTAAMANAMALPRSLEAAGAAAGLPVAKDKDGHALMLRMCKPRKVHDDGTVEWWEDAERMERLRAYCKMDVAVTQQLHPRLRALPADERQVWLLDAKANDRGVYVDLPTVRQAEKVVAGAEAQLQAELGELTGGEVTSAKQVQKLHGWLAAQGLTLPSLEKAVIEDALAGKHGTLSPDVRRAVEIRAELSKSSTAKLVAMRNRTCEDGRARGNLIYHAATTGRWAGTGIQLHNMPRGSIKDAERCLPAIQTGDHRVVEMVWDSPMSAVSSALRPMVTAGPGNELVTADFSNIEGRTLAWLARETWKVQAFNDFDAGTGPDLYKLAYSKSFNVSVASVDGDQRQIGKVQELALGFGGGKGAFQSMAAMYGMEVSDQRAEQLKAAWRDAHPMVCQLWSDLEDAARAAIESPGHVFSAGPYIKFEAHAGYLWCRLPKGRLLAYPRPSVEMTNTKFGKREQIRFWGEGMNRKWQKQSTYGGKLSENVTQAVARDVMADGIVRVEQNGFPVVLSVHDEVISEVPERTRDIQDYEKLLAQVPAWAAGLPVSAAGWQGKRYRKG